MYKMIKHMQEGKKWNLVFTGSRSLTDSERPAIEILARVKLMDSYNLDRKLLVVIQGEAKGIDTTAKEAAKLYSTDMISMPADWDNKGNGAGYIRNAEMVAKANEVIGVWDGVSKGTKHALAIAKKDKIPFTVFLENKVITPTEVLMGLFKASFVYNGDSKTIFNEAETLIKDINFNDLDSNEELLCKIAVALSSGQLESIVVGFMRVALGTYTNKGVSKNILTDCVSLFNKVAGKVKSFERSFVYIKLETGGLTGYNNSVGMYGENHYPILSLTIGVDKATPLTLYFNDVDSNNLDDYAKELHTKSGLLELIPDGVKYEDAYEILTTYLKNHGIVLNDGNKRKLVHLVGVSSAFNRKFLMAKLPKFLKLFSRKDISLSDISFTKRITGNRNGEFMVELATNPAEYVSSMIDYFNSELSLGK